MTVKLLTEHHLEHLSLTGGCIGWSESTLVKMPHCWKSHVAAHIAFVGQLLCLSLFKTSLVNLLLFFSVRDLLSSITFHNSKIDAQKCKFVCHVHFYHICVMVIF